MRSAIGKPYPIWTLALVHDHSGYSLLEEAQIGTYAFWDRADLEIFLGEYLFKIFIKDNDLSTQFEELWEDFEYGYGNSQIVITKSKIGSAERIEETRTDYADYGEALLWEMYQRMIRKQDEETINQLEEQEAA